MKNLIKVIYSNGGGNGQVTAKGGNFDAAFRNVIDANGNKVLTKVGRKSPEMFAIHAAKVGTTVIEISKNGKAVYPIGSTTSIEPIEPKQAVKVEPIEPKQEPIIEEPKPIDKIVEPKPLPKPPKTVTTVDRALFDGFVKPFLGEVEINQSQIDKMIDNKLLKHSKTLFLDKGNGEEPKKIDKQHYSFEDLLLCVSTREPVLIVGGAGGGKSHSVKAVADALDLAFYAISVGAMTTKTDFLGYMDANGNYIPTLFRKALELGGVFLIDEMDAGNANVLTTINMALSNEFAAFPDGMVEVHSDFVVVAGANTYGNGGNTDYVGRNTLDAATLDRFLVMDWGYDEELELMLGGENRWTRYVQKLRANLINAKGRYVISPRASIKGAKLLAKGMNIEKAKKISIFKGMTDEDIVTVTKGVSY